jgi:hypothetical protein
MSDLHPTRRDFLRATAASAAGLALANTAPAHAPLAPLAPGTAQSCIFINMVGGPAHLDTFDPKPDAPSDVRGPFRPIRTKVPGVHVSELFPKLAQLTDKFSLVRSMYHDAPPVHECGFQLLNTGHLFGAGPEWPSVGSTLARLDRIARPVVLPSLALDTGVNVSHGQGPGWLPAPAEYPEQYTPITIQSADLASFWTFKWSCKKVFHFLEEWQQFVTITINQFSTVFDSPSWDCHADGGSLRTNLNDIRNTVAPGFDTAFSALLTDLEARGQLDSTLVVATGEFGRTPKLNSNGGRDHWAGCWTALVAGGGVKGGRVIGRSDRTGTEPADRPVSPQELVASIFHALGVPHDATIPGPDGAPVAVYPGKPVTELF